MADCPCKQTLNDGERKVLNFGLTNEMLRNPNAAAIGVTRQLLGDNSRRIENILLAETDRDDPLSGPLGRAFPALGRVRDRLQNQGDIVNAFERESNRFTNPQELVRMISMLSLFAEMNCALGIKGLDIGVGVGVVNQNGQLAINYAVVANVDLEQVLNQWEDGLGSRTAASVRKLQDGVNKIVAQLDDANNAILGVMNAAAEIQNRAADFIQKYTSINTLATLINEANTDSCFKLGGTLNGGLVSPEFLNVVRGGNATGFGGGGFR